MQLCVLVRVGSPGGPDLDSSISCSRLAFGQLVNTTVHTTSHQPWANHSSCRRSKIAELPLAGNEAFLKLSLAHIAKDGRRLRASFFPDTLVVPSWQTGVPQGGSDLLAPLPRARLIILVPIWKSRLTRLIKAFVPHLLVYQTMWRSHNSEPSSKGATDREEGRGQVLFEYRVAWPTQNLSQDESV